MAFPFRVTTVLTLYHNLLILLPIPRVLHPPANLATAALLVRASRNQGLSSEELGLDREAVAPGIRWGAAVSSAIAAAVATALALGKGAAFRDERIARLSGRQLMYRLAVHIPLGTALPEEVLFRGVLHGTWAHDKGHRSAVFASSVAFGLWHIGPAIDRLRANPSDATTRERATAVAGTVAVTALAGVLLSVLRIRSKGVVGPIVAHWATNAFGTMASRLATEGDS